MIHNLNGRREVASTNLCKCIDSRLLVDLLQSNTYDNGRDVTTIISVKAAFPPLGSWTKYRWITSFVELYVIFSCSKTLPVGSARKKLISLFYNSKKCTVQVYFQYIMFFYLLTLRLFKITFIFCFLKFSWMLSGQLDYGNSNGQIRSLR